MRHPNLLDLAQRHATALIGRGATLWWALEQTRVAFGLTTDQVEAVRRFLKRQDAPGEEGAS